MFKYKKRPQLNLPAIWPALVEFSFAILFERSMLVIGVQEGLVVQKATFGLATSRGFF
jgi:hypothetical protein